MRWNRWLLCCSSWPALLLACGCVPFQFQPPPTPFSPPPPGGPPGFHPVSYQEPASMQAANLAQQLGEIKDENKVMAARLLEAQERIAEKERALAAARSEVRGVTDEVTRTREE